MSRNTTVAFDHLPQDMTLRDLGRVAWCFGVELSFDFRPRPSPACLASSDVIPGAWGASRGLVQRSDNKGRGISWPGGTP